ncbi:MAG: DUF1796 family putative cysteine peptidase [Bacteroidota bacterium]
MFFFFFGRFNTDSTLPTLDFYEAIQLLEKRYVVDCIVHIPKGIFFNTIHLYPRIQHFPFDQGGTDYPETLSFIYHQPSRKFYPFQFGIDTEGMTTPDIEKHIKKKILPLRRERLKEYRTNRPFHIISLGGWCGPAAATDGILRIRHEALPFDYINSTMSSVLEIAKGNLEAFYSLVGTSILTPHCDWSLPEHRPTMDRRLRRFIERLEDPKPILFFRGVIHVDYKVEFQEIDEFILLLAQKYGRTNDRYVLVLHDQGLGTVKLKMLRKNIMLWAAEGTVSWRAPDGDNINRNYSKIVEYCMHESSWEIDEQQLKQEHTIKQHQSWKKENKQLFPSIQVP